MKLLELAIRPGDGATSISTSSSPVGTTATRGARCTRTKVRPCAASTATSPARIGAPGVTTASPTAMSSPARRTCWPGRATTFTATASPERSVSSCMTTESAPAGMAAPVKMRLACPGPTGRDGTAPAAMVSITVSSTGEPGRAAPLSAARSA